MRKVQIRPTHFTFHREGPAPEFRIQADEPAAQICLQFGVRPQLFVAAQASQRAPDNYFETVAGSDGVAGQTLQLSQNKLRYQMPNPVWERLKSHPHIYYRALATAQAPADWTAAPPRTVRSVDDGYAERGVAQYFGVPNDRLQDPWNFPDVEPLNQVPAYYRAKLTLLTRLSESNEGAYILRRLAGHENYTSLPAAQRTKALLVFAAIDTPARRALLQMFSRVIPPTVVGGNSTPAVRSVDLSAQRHTLLDNLALLVDGDPHLDIPDGMDILVAEAVEEVADPSFEVNQGTKGTCVPTSVSWIVATYFPAEYIRLVRGLVAEGGRAILANGDPAPAPVDAFRYDPAEQSATTPSFLRRSWSERLFQASMMCYSRPGLTYSNIRDVFTDNRGGLTMTELCRLLRGLRNRDHRAITGAGADLVNTIAQRLQQPCLPVLTQLLWGSGSHEVVSTRADASDIIFRNPWGGMDYRVGQSLAAPSRRCVNPSQAEEAMARPDLAAAIQSLVVDD